MADQYTPSEVHAQRNRVTRGDWKDFAEHRYHVTDLILKAALNRRTSSEKTDPFTLCVLGAGNGNDLNLDQIADHFSKITLVDLDNEALEYCFDQQNTAVQDKLQLVPNVDLSGLFSLIQSAEVDRIVERAANPPLPTNLNQYDVVVSACLLTQMIDSVIAALGREQPDCDSAVLALRNVHLRFIRSLCLSKATAILVTDFVSSDTLPQLKTVSDSELQGLLGNAIGLGNFFTGVNPGVLAQRFRSVSSDGRMSTVSVTPPWRWKMGDRIYAVCALELQVDS